MRNMKQIVGMIALTALCSGARAEWVEIQKFEDGMRVYVDKATARRTDDRAEVMHLVRWGEAQGDDDNHPYRSTVVKTSYDCVNKLEKYQASTSYAGPMATGAVVISDEDEAPIWYSISEQSMEDTLWQIACGASEPLPGSSE